LSVKHAALWRKGKDWLSAKHASLWRKRLIVWVSGYCVLVERYVCLPADCWFIGLALWTVPDLPLCLGVLDHRAPLARGPFFLLPAKKFAYDDGAILNLKTFCFGAIPDAWLPV
jgi:hypothetical protein